MLMPFELAEVIKNPRALIKPRRPEPSYPQLPAVTAELESSIPGVYLVGEVAGTPLIKLGVNQGYDLVEQLSGNLKANPAPEGAYDLVVIGAGASGFSAMMQAAELGLRAVCLEAGRFASTVQNMTKGKILFAEPEAVALRGSVWFEECTREELLTQWARQRQQSRLDIREFEKVENIERRDGLITITSSKGSYQARRVILAIGKAGNPRKAGVPGEDTHAARIDHFLADPDAFQGRSILVYGGGDVACEAALRLCGHNTVIMATIDKELIYPKKRNREAVQAEVAAGRIELHMETKLAGVGADSVSLEGPGGVISRPADHVFEMIGAELPLKFFRQIGIRLSNDWGRGRQVALAVCMLLVYGLYAVKSSSLV
ncbi:MAG: thioredoxin reductase, partial [Myxococcota bacterium]